MKAKIQIDHRKITNIDSIEKEWRSKGYSFGLWSDPPGQVWKDYVHSTDELFMVLGGEVEIEMNGKTLRPQPSKEVLIPAQTVHTVRNIGRTTSQWLYGYQGVQSN
jgi:cupin 2 domain-containing protein